MSGVSYSQIFNTYETGEVFTKAGTAVSAQMATNVLMLLTQLVHEGPIRGNVLDDLYQNAQTTDFLTYQTRKAIGCLNGSINIGQQLRPDVKEIIRDVLVHFSADNPFYTLDVVHYQDQFQNKAPAGAAAIFSEKSGLPSLVTRSL